jgi:hypothetical protein
VTGQRAILPVRRLSSNGLKAWEQAGHRGYEGIVGKDPESLYVPGRTLRWLKVKQKENRRKRGDSIASEAAGSLPAAIHLPAGPVFLQEAIQRAEKVRH